MTRGEKRVMSVIIGGSMVIATLMMFAPWDAGLLSLWIYSSLIVGAGGFGTLLLAVMVGVKQPDFEGPEVMIHRFKEGRMFWYASLTATLALWGVILIAGMAIAGLMLVWLGGWPGWATGLAIAYFTLDMVIRAADEEIESARIKKRR